MPACLAAALALSACGKGGGARSDGKLRPGHIGAFTSCTTDSVTGEFTAKGDPRYRYRIADHGRTVLVTALLDEVPDAGNPSHDYVYDLSRGGPDAPAGTPGYPVGQLHFQAEHEGKTCTVTLSARITGCVGDGIVLASRRAGKMDWPTCHAEDSEHWNETPLVRAR